MKLLITLGLLACTLAPAAGAAAADGDTLYDVEMVVFQAVSPGPTEDWTVAPPGRGFGATPADPPAAGASASELQRLLPSRSYRLEGVVRGLRVSGAWRPVAHAAWVQTAPPWGSHIGLPLAQLGIHVPGLSGTVYLEKARLYLHLGFDVRLAAPDGPSAGAYVIDEMRNVRPNEKQYYDHPAFGIIAVVRPLPHGAG